MCDNDAKYYPKSVKYYTNNVLFIPFHIQHLHTHIHIYLNTQIFSLCRRNEILNGSTENKEQMRES